MDCPKHDEDIQILQNNGSSKRTNSFDLLIQTGLFCISAAYIAFEINLTRIFSIAQFYHFAFMIVSTALLGSAASGILLMVFPRIGRTSPKVLLSWTSLCASISMIGAYILFNQIPFDSFSISWDLRQAGVLLLHYLLLSMPFCFCGVAVSYLLNIFPKKSGRVYAVNLTGSALGCIFALVLPQAIGGIGIVTFCSGMTAIGALIFSLKDPTVHIHKKQSHWKLIWLRLPMIVSVMFAVLAGIDLGFRLFNRPAYTWMSLKISPYKELSHVMQFPDTRLLAEKWNAFSRVDLVESSAIRSLPGLSYRYTKTPPPENGLFIDGDDMSPVLISGESDASSDYLPLALAFRLRPEAKTLILEPRGGLDILTALKQGACCVTAVEQNPLMVSMAGSIYSNEKVRTFVEFERSYLKRSDEQFDLIVISLTSAYHPIQSGAYSLAEDYRYTVEALSDSIDHLNPNGILFFMRWLQIPPSEDLRAFALAVEALDRTGGDPQKQIVAFRGYNTATIVVKRTPLTTIETAKIRSFLSERAFDLSYSPDVRPQETNQYNILPESVYYQYYAGLIESQDRQSFYRQYSYAITPPTDDHPFMSHYFKWAQIGKILAEWGKTWQPFGGAGYLVIIGLLVITIFASSVLIILPWIFRKNLPRESANYSPYIQPPLCLFAYFACIGFGYLLIEIPLIQKFILFLEQPAYAFTSILFVILFFSGCGSLFADKIPMQKCLLGVVILIFILPILIPVVFERTLGLMMGWRMVITIILVAPLGFLMGIPFPAGLQWIIKQGYASQIPWFWGINGAASVISAVLAAMLALSFGFTWVLRIGAAAYLLGWLMVSRATRPARETPHRR